MGSLLWWLLLWWCKLSGAWDLEWEHWLLEVSQHGSCTPSSHPSQTQLNSPAALCLPHKLAGTDTNRLFIAQQRQIGRQGSQAANIDKEHGRNRVTHSRKTWMRAGMQHLGYHMNRKMLFDRNWWQNFYSVRLMCFFCQCVGVLQTKFSFGSNVNAVNHTVYYPWNSVNCTTHLIPFCTNVLP